MAYQNTKQFNHILYKNIKDNNYAEAKRLIEIGFNELSFKFRDRRGFISLVLNFHIDQKNDDDIDEIISNNIDIIMKRDLLNCSKYYYHDDYEKSEIIFRKLIDNFYFDNSCLDFLLENNMFAFLQFLDGKYLKTSVEGKQLLDYEILKNYQFDSDIVENVKNKIKKSINLNVITNAYIKIFENFINTNNLIIIDAGNILFSTSGKISTFGYKYLIDTIIHFISLDKVPIVVIHNRHLKLKYKGQLKSNKIINQINLLKSLKCIIVETPYNVNDDFYIIFLALQFESFIITNDNYKDHIFNFRSNEKNNMENMVENYIESRLIKYNLHSNKIRFDTINYFSKCIQIINNICYIPSENGFIEINLSSF